MSRLGGNSAVSACDGKRVYLTWTAANRVIRRMRRKGKAQRFGRAAPYLCQYCRKFHVGTGSYE